MPSRGVLEWILTQARHGATIRGGQWASCCQRPARPSPSAGQPSKRSPAHALATCWTLCGPAYTTNATQRCQVIPEYASNARVPAP